MGMGTGGEATVVNGVFEGGGAKGLVYVGALRACEDRHLTFGAVAGSSAGAITAMLVACGYTADEVEARMREGLQSLGRVAPATAYLSRRSLLSSKRLRKWWPRASSRSSRSRPPTGT